MGDGQHREGSSVTFYDSTAGLPKSVAPEDVVIEGIWMTPGEHMRAGDEALQLAEQHLTGGLSAMGGAWAAVAMAHYRAAELRNRT